MTLDEYIEHFNLVVTYAKRGEEYATNFSDPDNLIYFNTMVLGYLKELKTLRVELEKNSKELELYNRALEMACDTIADRDCTDVIACSRNSCELYALCFNEIDGKEYFLQKVREKNDQ